MFEDMNKTPSEPVSQLWKKEDVADYLGVTTRTVTTLMNSGALPYLKLGRAGARRVPVRFDPEQVKIAIRKQFTQ